MRHIKPVAVLLALIMIGGVGIAPVAAFSHQSASSSVSQYQDVDQVNVNHQSHNYGGVQISVQKNYNKQKAVVHAKNRGHRGGSGGPPTPPGSVPGNSGGPQGHA